MDYTNIQNIILFYSKFSNASKELLTILDDFDLTFVVRVCVDNANVRKRVEKKITKVPTLYIIYKNNALQICEGADTFKFIQQIIKDSQIADEEQVPPSQPPPSQPPRPKKEQTPIEALELSQLAPTTDDSLDFNMVSNNPNKYMLSEQEPKQFEPKSIVQNQIKPTDDLEFKMLEPKIQQQQQELPQRQAPQSKGGDDSKINVQQILEGIKIDN
jgi:hypothetical protein